MMAPDHMLSSDFELCYLAELTLQRIKPLSRWEKPLDRRAVRWLKRRGFSVETVKRKTRMNRPVSETVFSLSSRYVDLYAKKFAGTPINHNPETRQLEGFLFGYPSCCVRQFIRHPYAPNTLRHADQSLLFHWACPHCRVTQELVPYYRSVHDRIEAKGSWLNQKTTLQNSPSRKTVLAAAAVLLISAGLLPADSKADETHFIPLPDDVNQNGLTSEEEIYLGAYYEIANQPCQTWAAFFQAAIDSLPDSVQTDQPYKLNHPARGIVPCPKCGEYVNMGYVTLIHPRRRLQMDIPYLGVHFLEHGWFSYGDNTDYERVDVDTLKRILFPFDPDHMLPVPGDSDGDGLTDAEEDSLWMEETAGSPDWNQNGVPDGADLAEELIRLFPDLQETPDGAHSHIALNPMWGMETCEICGSSHNMGFIEIFNPENAHDCQIPFLALHALAHGSFAYNGTVHPNQRLDAVELVRAMKTHLLFIQDDPDRDGLNEAEEAYFGFHPDQADTDSDGILDGVFLARALADSIRSLPAEPRTTGPYVEFLGMDGVHLCSVCGREVVMGVIRIFNPLMNTIDPFEISNYAFHFLEHGSFACGGALDERIDAVLLSQYLHITPSDVNQEPAPAHPDPYRLGQNYPNPFNHQTMIPYTLNQETFVRIAVYDVFGRAVSTLIESHQTAGTYEIRWDGKSAAGAIVSSGLYYVRLKTSCGTQTRKLLFIK